MSEWAVYMDIVVVLLKTKKVEIPFFGLLILVGKYNYQTAAFLREEHTMETVKCCMEGGGQQGNLPSQRVSSLLLKGSQALIGYYHYT